MEGNGHVLPPQPIPFIRCDNNQRFLHMTAGTTFPITISIYSAIKLYFVITRDNVSIITSNHNEPHLHAIPQRRNNLNNNAEEFNLPNNGGELNLPNNGGAVNFQNMGEAVQIQNIGETLLLNLHHLPNMENGSREALKYLELLSQFHCLTLRNLPTLPAYIHITSNNHTIALYVTNYNAIYVNGEALPIPPPQNDENFHVINQPITIPMNLILIFNNPTNNTIMTIFIQFHPNDTVFIFANSRRGLIQWAAMLDFTPEA